MLMIVSLRVDILFSLVIHQFLENQANNTRLLILLPRLSIKPWLMALLRFYGFNIYYLICKLSLHLCLWFGVIICLRILSSMLVLNMLSLIIILYVTGLLKRKFIFVLFLPMISLPMFLLSHFLLLILLLFSSSSELNLHLQLERAYYRKLNNIGCI